MGFQRLIILQKNKTIIYSVVNIILEKLTINQYKLSKKTMQMTSFIRENILNLYIYFCNCQCLCVGAYLFQCQETWNMWLNCHSLYQTCHVSSYFFFIFGQEILQKSDNFSDKLCAFSSYTKYIPEQNKHKIWLEAWWKGKGMQTFQPKSLLISKGQEYCL